jgi:hypothetical protein
MIVLSETFLTFLFDRITFRFIFNKKMIATIYKKTNFTVCRRQHLNNTLFFEHFKSGKVLLKCRPTLLALTGEGKRPVIEVQRTKEKSASFNAIGQDLSQMKTSLMCLT